MENLNSKLTLKRISIPFCQNSSYKIRKIFRKFNYDIVFRNLKFKNLLCNYKDVVDSEEKSGIYKITCEDCDKIYIGQTSRNFRTRLKEHYSHYTKKENDKSAVALHLNEYSHQLSFQNSKLIVPISKDYKLDAYESLYMKSFENQLMNKEDPPISSILFSLRN